MTSRILTKCFLFLLVSGLSACAGFHHGSVGDGSHEMDRNRVSADEGAQSRGVGEGETWSENNIAEKEGHQNLLAQKTYYFAFDSSEISNQSRPAILANADWLTMHPEQRILLEGHTDPRGSREYNIALGERRAESVAALMRSRGVTTDQIRVVSYGMEKPAIPGNTEAAYAKDRRAVIVIAEK